MGKKSKKEPPGLDRSPSLTELSGLDSLMPPASPKKPNVLVRLIKLPLRLVMLPVKLVLGLVRLPFRVLGAIFGRGSRRDDDTSDD